jgi:hypothetical protein
VEAILRQSVEEKRDRAGFEAEVLAALGDPLGALSNGAGGRER